MIYTERLRANDYEVRPISYKDALALVVEYHYAKGASNTATALHALYRKGNDTPLGVAWWIPPTRRAAYATFPEDWQAVLALLRAGFGAQTTA